MEADAQVFELSQRLERHFSGVWRRSMADVPICNPALSVASVGFREWNGQALGVVVTPWFMNVILAPLDGGVAISGNSGDSRPIWLPAGKVEFLVSKLEGFETLLMCSLFSPMDEFIDQEAAIATADAALQALLDSDALASAVQPETHAIERAAPQKSAAERAEMFREREEAGPPQMNRRALFFRSERKAAPQ